MDIGEALSALQGIGEEPVTDRGLSTEAQMADTIQTARETGTMTLEDHEKAWAEIPPIEERDIEVGEIAGEIANERDHEFDEAEAEFERSASPEPEPEKSNDFEMEM